TLARRDAAFKFFAHKSDPSCYLVQAMNTAYLYRKKYRKCRLDGGENKITTPSSPRILRFKINKKRTFYRS
ncbi:hypothetical protein, partial [Escherichia coli]|uniref:hypothetical protein n=1 Tax=Escherichia coli TaxID=562 RepID=UPI00202040D6